MSIGDVCPKESEEPTQAQDQPSSSNQASPPTQDEDQAQDDENEDQEDEPPQEEDNDQGGDEEDQNKEDDQEIQDQGPPHPRDHQAIQRDQGAQVPQVGDKDYDSDEVAQIRHFNSQATTILLASLSREEYNKVHGLETAKDIWDVLKTAHEGDKVTKITKRETIEGELG
jgi:hypothetical protein